MVAFILPVFPKAIIPVAFLFILNWLLSGDFLHIKILGKERREIGVALLVLLWILLAISVLYSDNLQEGLFRLEVKLSLMLIPLALSGSLVRDYPKARVQTILLSFLAGVFASSVFLLMYAAIHSFKAPSPSYWNYTGFSVVFHPSYFSIYLLFASAILLFYLSKEKIKLAVVLLLAFFALIMVFINSKSGFIGLFMLYASAFVYFLIRKPFNRRNLFYLAIPIMVFCSGLLLLPSATNRIKETVTTAEIVSGQKIDNQGGYPSSTSMRLKIWRTALTLASEHPLAGVGIGDVQSALDAKYRDLSMTLAYTKHLNAHNQFLQTSIAIGIPSLLILLLILLIPFISAWKSRDWLFGFFLALMAVNFLFESMLEAQAGVVFFVFFYVLLTRFRTSS